MLSLIALTGVRLEKFVYMAFFIKFFLILLPSNSDGSGRNIFPDFTLKDIFRNSINLKYGLQAQTEKII